MGIIKAAKLAFDYLRYEEEGEEPEVNDTESYDNGTGIIPTYLCDPVVVTVDNYKEMLIDSGYYTEDQIQ